MSTQQQLTLRGAVLRLLDSLAEQYLALRGKAIATSRHASSTDILHELPTDMLEEYKLCQQKASGLDDNIWKTALLLGAGSLAAFIALAGKDTIAEELRPWASLVAGGLASGALIAWFRFVRRWGSIQQALFRRMEHLERMSRLRANLYIAHLDPRKISFASEDEGDLLNPYIPRELLKDLDELGNHESRGIQPMARFLVEMTILLWLMFTAFLFVPLIPPAVLLPDAVLVRGVIAVIIGLVIIGRLVSLYRGP